MTHKDFVLIAGALASARANARTVELENGVDRATHALADTLAGTNPRFNRSRFLAAAQGNPLTGRDVVRS
jgi:hypothetical protein